MRGSGGVLRVDPQLVGGAVFWAGLGLSGSGWLWRPVGVPAELLGEVHVASFGCHLPGATHPAQKSVRAQVNAPLKVTQPQK